MSSKTRGAANGGDSRSWGVAAISSPLLWGGLLTVGFYALIPALPVYRELAERYFAGHWIEYVTAALFFVGMAMLGRSALAAAGEKAALTADLLDADELTDGADAAARSRRLEQRLQALPARLRRSLVAQRIKDACWYVRTRRSGEGLEEHLKYLADQAAERLHGRYGLLRTITWAIPILGFLGTVMGITLAIANITPDQLESSLKDVTGGLAVAFDTTALSLALSLVLVFATLVVERSEQQILSRIEDLATTRLVALFPAAPPERGPLADIETQAAQQLLERTESLITWQTTLWQESLESLRQRWTGTLEGQQQAFDAALQSGMAATLADHGEQLQSVRGEFLHAFQHAARHMHDGLAALQTAQAEQIAHLVQSLSAQTAVWTDALRQGTEASRAQCDELRKQGEILLKIAGQEEQLTRLQQRLNENLEGLRATEAFEETLHSLSAAVHLLTTRAGGKKVA